MVFFFFQGSSKAAIGVDEASPEPNFQDHHTDLRYEKENQDEKDAGKRGKKKAETIIWFIDGAWYSLILSKPAR